MTAVPLRTLFDAAARPIVRQGGEIVHVAAVYLGIAALVAIALGALVPSVRQQARQVHRALVVALEPDSLRPGADAASSEQYNLLVAQAEKATPSLQLTFMQEIRAASLNGLQVKNVSAGQLQALRSYIARKYKIASSVAGALIETAFRVGDATHLDPQLLLAVIAIESRYNPYAESHVGAQGLMQVMTSVHEEKFNHYEEGVAAALNPIANIRVGAQILKDCVKRRGSVAAGLACYVGATGSGDGGYGARVLAEQRRLALASGIPIDNP